MLPGRPGGSHDHTYVGNVSTDAFSTLELAPQRGHDVRPQEGHGRVLGADALRRRQAARPARRGRLLPPAHDREGATYPDGLTIVAGNSRAATPQSRSIVFWDCGDHQDDALRPDGRAGAARGDPARGVEHAAHVPAGVEAPAARQLPGLLERQDASTATTTSATWPTPSRGRCPRSHPVAVPMLSLVYQYPPPTGAVALSSGSVYSAHADFLNAWDEEALEHLVTRCLNELRPCGTGS